LKLESELSVLQIIAFDNLDLQNPFNQTKIRHSVKKNEDDYI